MASIIEKAKGIFAGALKKKGSGSVLGIDVSSSTIKVVQIRKKHGRAVLETYGELALGPYAGIEEGKATALPPEKMAEALKDLMTEAKVTTKDCGVAIPLSSSLINVIQMPDVGDKKLKEMVPLEMRKYIPVSIQEVFLDWRVIPRAGSGNEESNPKDKVDMLIVAIHKETINSYKEILKTAGLTPSFFEIEVFSTIRSTLDGDTGPVLIIDIGAGTTKIYIAEHRVLRESHIINRGSQDITLALSKSMGIPAGRAKELKHAYGVLEQTEKPDVNQVVTLVLDSIFNEAHRAMLNYQKKNKQNIEHIYLSGGGAGLPGIVDVAKKFFETDVLKSDPFEKLTHPAFLEDVLDTAGPEFAVSVGVALRKLDELE